MQPTIKVVDLVAQENDKNFLRDVIVPQQTHSTTIVEIKTGREDLRNCDGLFSANQNRFSLGVRTADCAAICFYDAARYGVVHAGWRGLVNGIVEKMLANFVRPNIFVAPLLNVFEIQKDDCYKQIARRFGERYFRTEERNGTTIILFDFLGAVRSVLPENAVFDLRDTFAHSNLASWRRDRDRIKRNYTIITGAGASARRVIS